MRNDYNHPPDWNSYTDIEKSNWYTRNRCLRRAIKQDTTFSRRFEKQSQRRDRIKNARNSTVDILDMR